VEFRQKGPTISDEYFRHEVVVVITTSFVTLFWRFSTCFSDLECRELINVRTPTPKKCSKPKWYLVGYKKDQYLDSKKDGFYTRWW
jgi:hypothetical protein